MKKVIFIIVCLVFSLGFAQKQVVDATGYDEQSEAEKNAITTRDGLKRWVVYSSQNNRFEWWDGVAWYPLGSDAGASIEGILEEGSFATSDRKITIGNAETSIVFDLTEDEEEITFDYLSGTEIDVTNVTANYGSFNSIEVTGAVTGSSFNGVVLDSDNSNNGGVLDDNGNYINSYNTIQKDAVALAEQHIINFTGAGVTVTNDSNNDATIVNIDGGSDATPLETATTVIDLSSTTNNYGYADTSTTSDAFTLTGVVTGGKAQILIDTTGDTDFPTVTGSTLTNSAPFEADVEYYMMVENNGNRTEHYFVKRDIGNATFLEATKTGTGTAIDMSGLYQYNFGAASSAIVFTMENIAIGGYGATLINTTSQPTVIGATITPDTASWVTGTDFILHIQDYNGTRKFWFTKF